jgi:hypothetical protein
MGKIQSIKTNLAELSSALKEITHDSFYSEFVYFDVEPNKKGQYWKYELSIIDESLENSISIPIGFFSDYKRRRNFNLDINTFFAINNEIVNEFYEVHDNNGFKRLIPILNKLEHLQEQGYYISLNVHANIIGGTHWLRKVCDEYMLIIHLDDSDYDKLHIGVQQSERYKIKALEDNKDVIWIIPFDKCDLFKDYKRIYSYTDVKEYDYDVTLSFAGEDREYVNEVAEYLKKFNINCFYDFFEEVSLWGKDLYQHLDDIYRNKSLFCIIFISKHYSTKQWTNHELESAQARALVENKEYILPVRLDATEMPRIRSTTSFLDGRKKKPMEIAQYIIEKIKQIKGTK